ncbi:MAG: DUF1365 domain-containing protein [Hyphomicrobiales bacterium]
MLQRLAAKPDLHKDANKAACLYVGDVMHARLKPFTHRFNYRVFNLLIDLDRLDEANQLSTLFTVNGRGVVGFKEKDHGGETETGLADFIRATVAQKSPNIQIDEIRLLCYPRILGYVFNPISIYYCLHNGEISAMVYEVRNTFGNKHIYVEPVKDSQISAAGLRQECDKSLHVSPFVEMGMTYFFRVSKLGESIKFRILERDDKGPLLSATLKATRENLSNKNLSIQLIKIPFLTLKVMAGIHFEALRLWIKGAKFIKNPHKNKGLIDPQ